MSKSKFKKGDKVYVKSIPEMARGKTEVTIYYPNCCAYIRRVGGWYTYYLTENKDLSVDTDNFGVHNSDIELWIEPIMIDEELFEI
jgi:hypothetical protein